MALNGSNQATIDHRRRIVASLRLRGLTQREIVSVLPQQDIVNHDTGEPWSLGTINRDLQAIEAEWKTEALKDISEHKARQLAEIGEVKRAAWKDKQLDTVLRGIGQEVKILGTEQPAKYEHTVGGGLVLLPAKMEDEED